MEFSGSADQLNAETRSARRSVKASVEIGAPVETVYDYWQTLENLSQFMSDIDGLLTEVNEFSHWTLYGSFGATVEFNALTTLGKTRNTVLEGVESQTSRRDPSGRIHFEEAEPDLTRVEVRMDCTELRGGEAGESARAVHGPELRLDQYFQSLKSSLEGRNTQRELQDRAQTATARGELAALIAAGVGFALVTAILLLLVSRAVYKSLPSETYSGKGPRSRLYQPAWIPAEPKSSSGH